MRIPGIDALFHDPAAALLVDGRTVAAAEDERFGRRGHGERPLPLSTREPPGRSARRCPERAGPGPAGPLTDQALRGARGEGIRMTSYAVVVPTLLRDTLADCLAALAAAHGPRPDEIVLVDDRPDPDPPPDALAHALTVLGDLRERTTTVATGGRGPAAARNAGLRAVTTPWVAFLDDDVQVGPHWCAQLVRDLEEATSDTAGVQGVITVPLPGERRPTDWERGTAGLTRARWITADMAYRTEALRQVGGFDERFPRAFREDADLALRLLDAGWRIRKGRRTTLHPVRSASRWASVGQQRGNADDALMRRLHGPDWWDKAVAPRGRIRRHAAITAAGAAACALAAAGHRRAATACALGWAAGTAEFARARIVPGPRTRDEVTTVLATSVVIPPAATWHRLAGAWRHRNAPAWQEVAR